MAPKLSKAEREKRKREEQERLAALEAQRLKEEREEEERRLEQLRIEEEERQRKLDEQRRRFDADTAILQTILGEQLDRLHVQKEKIIKDAEWKHYRDCVKTVDVSDIKAVSSFIREWTDAPHDSETGLQDTLAKWQEANEIMTKIDWEIAKEEEGSKRRSFYQELKVDLAGLIKTKLDYATQALLVTTEPHINKETFNLEKSEVVGDLVYHLWGNTARNPRLKTVDLGGKLPVSLDLPRELILGSIALRIVHSNVDTLSATCSSFHAGKPVFTRDSGKNSETAEAEGQVDAPGGTEESMGNVGDAGAGTQPSQLAAAAETTSTVSLSSNKSGRGSKTGDGQPSAKSTRRRIRSGSAESSASKMSDNDDDDDDGSQAKGDDGPEEEEEVDPDFPNYEKDGDEVDDENVVDLRCSQIIGGIYYFDVLDLPPQSKVKGKWKIQEVAPSGLQYTTYPLPELKTKSRKGEDEDEPEDAKEGKAEGKAEEKAEGKAEQKAEDQTTSPEHRKDKKGTVKDEPQVPPTTATEALEITIRTVPDVHVQDIKMARWEPEQRCWRTDGVNESFVFNEKKCEITFKTIHVAPFALIQERYACLPIDDWDIRPTSDNQLLLHLGLSDSEFNIIIKDDQCQIPTLPPIPEVPAKDEDSDSEEAEREPVDPVEHLRGEWMHRMDLQERLTYSGVNIFPLEDGHQYLKVLKKARKIESQVYQYAASLAPAFGLGWSSKNEMADRNVAVVKVLEFPGDAGTTGDNCALFAVKEDTSWQLNIKDDSDAEFDLEIANDQELHPDLFSAVRAISSPKAIAAITSASPVCVDTARRLLESIRPLVYS